MWLIMVCSGSRKRNIHGTRGKASSATSIFGTVADWNLKKQRVWKLLAHMRRITSRSTPTCRARGSDGAWSSTVAGGLLSLKTRKRVTEASMFATSVEPTRLSWKMKPSGSRAVPAASASATATFRSTVLEFSTPQWRPTRSRNMGVSEGCFDRSRSVAPDILHIVTIGTLPLPPNSTSVGTHRSSGLPPKSGSCAPAAKDDSWPICSTCAGRAPPPSSAPSRAAPSSMHPIMRAQNTAQIVRLPPFRPRRSSAP